MVSTHSMLVPAPAQASISRDSTQKGARARDPAARRLTMCNAQAKAKSLSGTKRSKFMKGCLRADSGHSHAMNSQQMKMKTCNADATAKALKGGARKAFMSSCLKKS